MRNDWLRAAALLSAAGGVWLWTSASPMPPLKPLPNAPVEGSKAVRRSDAPRSLADDDRRGAVIGARLDAESKRQPRSASTRKFRQLPAKRDPQLEANPQFQKLLEMDSARKMALLEHDDQEAMKRVLAEMHDGSAKISRQVLEQALVDPNAEVRLAALFEISLEFDDPPLDMLGPVVESDPSAEVRLEALEMIGESDNEEADALIEAALGDPDEAVSSEAQDLLEARSAVL